MTAFLHQIFSGLAMGGIYAILALALVMIYQATHLVNFAQGEMAMFSTYVAWAMIDAGVPYWARVRADGRSLVHRRHGDRAPRACARSRDAPVLTLVIVFIGLLLIFNSVAGWLLQLHDQELRQSVPGQAVVRQRLHVLA